MVLGIGTDILRILSIRDIYDRADTSFFNKTFTYKEQEQALERSDPVLYFATRFAGKEAVFKSIGIDGNQGRLNEIEILGTETGQPQVLLTGKLSGIAAQKGIRSLLISLSYDNEYAIAFAIAQG